MTKDEEAYEFYTNFVPHVDKINYDHPVFDLLSESEPVTDEEVADCQLMADYISDQLCQRDKNGECPWWSHDDFKRGSSYLHPLQIEKKILVDQIRDRWFYKTKYGTDPYVHYLNIIRLMTPESDITPPMADIVQLKLAGFTFKKKYLHLIGSKDAGKSSTTGRAGWANKWLFPEKSFTISATPTLLGAQMTLFGDFTELAEQIKEAHPLPPGSLVRTKKAPEDASSLFPSCKINRSSYIDVSGKAMSKGGFIQHRALRDGLALGSKGLGKDKREGISLYSIDESNKHNRLDDFEEDLDNAETLPSFFMMTTQNPTSQTNAGALLAKPVVTKFTVKGEVKEWGVDKFHHIERDDLLLYPTPRNGIAYRLDGFRSVNIRSGKCIYPYLLKQWQIDLIANDSERGPDSDPFRSQIRALFETTELHEVLLPMDEFITSRYNTNDYTILKTYDKYLSIDFAHSEEESEREKGHRDPAVIMTARHCLIRVANGDGRTNTDIDAFVFDRRPFLVKFKNGFLWERVDANGEENRLFTKYLHLAKDKAHPLNDAPLASKMTYEQQIAIEAGMIAEESGVPRSNIMFDCSMRAESTSAIRLILGHAPKHMPLRDKPTGYKLKIKGVNTEDIARNVNSESMFLAADVVMSKAVRGGGNIQEALEEMTKRSINSKTQQPVSKKDFKLAHGFSPNHQDCFTMIVWQAYENGFNTDDPYDSHGEQEDSTYQRAKKMAGHNSKIMQRLS